MIAESFRLFNGVVSLILMAGVMLMFYLSGLNRSRMWTIIVTPLASIIGSGFLVVAPLLYQNFGPFHLLAIVVLNAVALAVGWVMRTNIKHFEPILVNGNKNGPTLILLERVAKLILGLSFIVSVAFYLTLLSSFSLEALGVRSPAAIRIMTTVLLLFIGTYGYTRGLHGMEALEKIAVNVKLSIIAGLLLALGLSAVYLMANGGGANLTMNHRLDLQSLQVFGGMLLVVQGFETARYLGRDYSPEERAKGQFIAQLIAAGVYVLFVPLAAPLALDLSRAADETAIISIVGRAAVGLATTLSFAAIFSQFGAAVADTVGTGGIIEEETRGWIRRRVGYLIVTSLAVLLLWTRDVFSVLTIASRAFALFYCLQSIIAFVLVIESPGMRYRRIRLILFPIMAALLLLIALFAFPAHYEFIQGWSDFVERGRATGRTVTAVTIF
ncbi:MAG TPA: hypothetical protein VJK02_11910 [Anaerolineales bacterium]|nr:hypothetical protein [Anaerolineales bacterium]